MQMRRTLGCACLLLVAHCAVADDIDIYLRNTALAESYVHVLLDLGNLDVDGALCRYGGDCRPPFMTPAAYAQLDGLYADGEGVTAVGVFKAVLAAVIEQPVFDDLHLSLLVSNHQDNSADAYAPGVGGGTILAGYKRLGDGRGQLLAMLKSLPLLPSAQAHVLQPRESYFEWYRYINGGDVALGTNTRGNFGQSNPSPNYDDSIVLNGKYRSPFAVNSGCPRLYSIIFSVNAAGRDDDLSPQIAAETSLAPDVTFEQLLAFMHDAKTDLVPAIDHKLALQKSWVVSTRGREGRAGAYATAGGTESVLYVNEPAVLEKQLTQALQGVIGVSSSFVAATVPVDVFNRQEALEDVYIPLFKARIGIDWPGNLKKLRLVNGSGDNGVDSNAGIVDVHAMPAFESSGPDKGRLRFDALTFWTDVGSLPAGDDVILPREADGREVTRGGAGQKIDGFVQYRGGAGGPVQYFIGDSNADDPVAGYPPRQLFYEPESGSALLPFDANAATRDALADLLDPRSLLSKDELLDLIRWGRGQDVDNGKATARSWIMGDILHSRPVALNYGATSGYSQDNPNIRLLFGTGEGLFHIVENTDTSGNETGREIFGFYPAELLDNINLRRRNAAPAVQMRYGVDGQPVILQVDRNGDGTLDHTEGDLAYVYFGLRRGGRSYFALDVSNPAVTPSLVWKISPARGPDFAELGLSFSTPVVGKVNYNGSAVDVLIFAGGYNGGWNPDYTARRGKDLDAGNDRLGNAIYIVNARTGDLVWKAVQGVTGNRSNVHYEHAGLVDSIPSAVTALKSPGGFIHRLYVGDSGGAVWRVDLPQGTAENDNHRRDHWFITKLADLGSDAAEAGGTVVNDLRFFHAPDVVRTFDASGDLDGILIQSGNRADPNETTAENHLFYLKDREIVSGSDSVRLENDAANPPGRYVFSDLQDQTACVSGTESVVVEGESAACQDLLLASGWKIRYAQPGEKGLSTPLVEAGRVFATTFIPASGVACTPQEGQGQAYVVSLADGTAVANGQRVYDLGPGAPAGAILVEDNILVPGSGIDLYDLDGDGQRDVSKILPGQARKFYRTYWSEPGADSI